MNYPIWLLEHLGGGTMIAMIAVLHVYISHLAVGGGLFIWLLDRQARANNDLQLNDFLRRYNWVFLLVTMVLGGLTGVGIWFIIALVSPGATSALIHTFVFGWAIEWVFFIGEIVALLVYHYYFDKISRAAREKVAFFYFLFAFLSLVIINGILSFMLTPGKWLETRGFWDGFFNPTYFSSLFFRTFAAVMVAGIFGFVVGAFQKDKGLADRVVKISARWSLIAVVGLLLTGVWYYFSIPAGTREIAFQLNPQTIVTMNLMFWMTAGVAVLGLLLVFKMSNNVQRIFAIVLIAFGAAWMAGFEYTREIARKPFVIHDYMYSTGILVEEVDAINEQGLLKMAKWTSVDTVTAENQMEAGRELMRVQCLACHTLGGRNDLISRTANFPYMGMLSVLEGQGKVMGYMPPFVGTEEEKVALATYIVKELNGGEIVTKPDSWTPATPIKSPKPKKPINRDYVLLAWNDLGMHCLTDADGYFSILPPANTLEAQLIKRGNPPMVVAEGVELSYEVDPEFKNSADHVSFWEYDQKLFGVDLEPNVGLAGKGLEGTMDLEENGLAYHAMLIPVTPYPDGGGFNPYPMVTVRANDADGNLIAETRAVLPTSTEMGCRNCHGGGWRHENSAGVSDETARNILATHDQLSGTDLLKQAEAGNPMLCQSCHGDPAIGAEGKPGHLSLSAAVHGWHANYMPYEGWTACQMCHPAPTEGYTRCLRGVHMKADVTCEKCHGSLEEHAAGLLVGEMEKGNMQAERMTRKLMLEQVASIDEVNGRTPWLNEPQCETCHVDFDKPAEGASSYNDWTSGGDELYRNKSDFAGAVRCIACHGSPHAVYPATNDFDKNRDNYQPLQYQGNTYAIGEGDNCTVCHTVSFDFAVHHDNLPKKARIR